MAYASLATLLQLLLAFMNFIVDSKDELCLYKQKGDFYEHNEEMVGAQAAENHGDEWGLIWFWWWRIYKSIPTWTHSKHSLAAKHWV